MEQYKKFRENFDHLNVAINKVNNAKSIRELNEADNEIGATLRSLQYGVGVVGIECKQLIDAKRRAGFAPLTQQRKQVIVEKATKKTTKRRKKNGN